MFDASVIDPQAIENLRSLNPGDNDEFLREIAAIFLEDTPQRIAELEEMSGAGLSQAHWIAKIYAALNDKELAISWLEHGLGAGAIGFFYKDEPVWDAVRSDPRFGDLMRRMGVPQ